MPVFEKILKIKYYLVPFCYLLTPFFLKNNHFVTAQPAFFAELFVMPKYSYRKLTLSPSGEQALLRDTYIETIDSLNKVETPRYTVDGGMLVGIEFSSTDTYGLLKISGLTGYHYVRYGEWYKNYIINDAVYNLLYCYAYWGIPFLGRISLSKKKLRITFTVGFGVNKLIHASGTFKPYHEKYRLEDTVKHAIYTKISYLEIPSATLEGIIGAGFEYAINKKTRINISFYNKANNSRSSLAYFLYTPGSNYAYQKNYSYGFSFSLIREIIYGNENKNKIL